uniref:Uncharacterized protein n=1 Tax=Cannabis sativa TaxID=3483 RepID=A0A803QRW8_CANSA
SKVRIGGLSCGVLDHVSWSRCGLELELVRKWVRCQSDPVRSRLRSKSRVRVRISESGLECEWDLESGVRVEVQIETELEFCQATIPGSQSRVSLVPFLVLGLGR